LVILVSTKLITPDRWAFTVLENLING